MTSSPATESALPSTVSHRPTTSHADEWQLWLQENADSGSAYLAVQIVEAIEEHQRALAREVYGLAENTAERFSDLASEDTPEGHYNRGAIGEAKSIARAVCAIMPYSRDTTALKASTRRTAAPQSEGEPVHSSSIRSEALEEAAKICEKAAAAISDVYPDDKIANVGIGLAGDLAAKIRALKEGK